MIVSDYPKLALFIVLTVVLLVSSSCGGEEVRKRLPVQPNIILIMADDLGYETLGVNGSNAYSTPNLDALANNGMRFTSAYATPLCTPTRVQLMTGKYNFRNYVGFGILDPGELTFGHLLQDAGYTTFIAGKWQLFGNPQQQELFNRSGTLPEDAGFDEYYLWQIASRPGSRFKDPGLNLMSDSVQTLVGAFGPDVFADSLIGFAKRHKEAPFFAYFPMTLTHDPFQPTPGHPAYDSFDPAIMKVNDPTYFADNVAYMDKIVGRIADAIDEMGIRDNTLILFMGDNGTDRDITSPFGDGEIRGNKGYPTKSGTHVPMIASWPGTINPGQINDNLIDFTDFVPTLMDVANAKLPKGGVFDGLSFYDQFVGRADSVRSWVFCHYAPQWGGFEPARFAHNREWKLYGDGRIFNVSVDPMELSPIPRSTLKPAAEIQIKSFEEVLHRLQ